MVKIGVVGVGNMGSTHCKRILDGFIEGAVLFAICDINEERIKLLEKEINLEKVKKYTRVDDILADSEVEAIIVATPHYSHPEIGIKALQWNKHVMVEKPLAVYSLQAKELLRASEMNKDCIFGIMLNQRTNPFYKKAKDLLMDGEIGEIRRISWTITDWYRTQAYYDSALWRATWDGEGGGVIINQCPHNLDLITWLIGMPSSVMAFCKNGKYHDIETEDEATVFMEFGDKITGTLVASTGETPGTNYIEIIGTCGKIVLEGINGLKLYKTKVDGVSFVKEEFKPWKKPEYEMIDYSEDNELLKLVRQQHTVILQNWVDCIKGKDELIAPGKEGLKSLMLCNAIYFSSWLERKVNIPFDEDMFLDMLEEKRKKSIPKKILRELNITIGEQPYL